MKLKSGPREKLMEYGIDSLSDAELMAILIKTGSKGENVLELSKKILDEISSLSNLNDYTISELARFKGVGIVKAMTIVCAIELGNRIRKNKNYVKRIKTPKDAYEFLMNDFLGLSSEKVVAIYLDASLKIVSKYQVAIGEYNRVVIDIKEIVKRALKLNADYCILAHNHPTGLLYPSKEDMITMDELEVKLKEFGIVFFDSIIITHEGYYSMKYSINSKKEL